MPKIGQALVSAAPEALVREVLGLHTTPHATQRTTLQIPG
jgi:hypothetical protein